MCFFNFDSMQWHLFPLSGLKNKKKKKEKKTSSRELPMLLTSNNYSPTLIPLIQWGNWMGSRESGLNVKK